MSHNIAILQYRYWAHTGRDVSPVDVY